MAATLVRYRGSGRQAPARTLPGGRLKGLPPITLKDGTAASPPSTTATELPAVIIADTASGTQQLHLTLRRRPRRERWTWTGVSSDGRYAVSLTQTKRSTWSLQLRAATEPDTVTPLLELLDEMRQLATSRSVRLEVGGQTIGLADMGDPAMELPAGHEDFLRGLGRLAQHLGVDLRIPDRADADHVHDVVAAAALLDGKRIRETYDEATLLVVTDELEGFREGPLGGGPVRVVCRQVWQVELDELIEIPIEVTYVSAVVPEWPAAADAPVTPVSLRPWQSREAIIAHDPDGEHRLLLTPLPRVADREDEERPLFAGSLQGGATTHRGRWVAVHEGRVVAVEDSPAELLASLADSGTPYETVLPLRDAPWDGTPLGL